jgi:hypothetical protein
MARAARPQRQTAERNIYFYRANWGFLSTGEPRPINPTPWLHAINGLAFTEAGRYLEIEPGLLTCCWVDRDRAQQRLRVGTIRRSGLPQLERAGQLTDLPIPATSGLAEQVHVIFFGNNIVGSEFNFYGPRLSRLSDYLAERAGVRNPRVTFVLQQLNRLGEIRLLQMRIKASFMDTIAQLDQDLGAAFEAARRATDAEEVELTLKMTPHSRQPLSHRVVGFVRRLARRADTRTEMSQFIVRGVNNQTNRVEVVDALSDHLIAKKQIVRESARSRALDTAAAYAAIEQAYDELRDELQAAAAAGQ